MDTLTPPLLLMAVTVITMIIAGFNVETVVYKNITITCWDVGGQDKHVHVSCIQHLFLF